MASGVEPSKILLITLTDSAAMEMKDRIANLIGDVAEHVNCGTFHSVCDKIVKENHETVSQSSHFQSPKGWDSYQLKIGFYGETDIHGLRK